MDSTRLPEYSIFLLPKPANQNVSQLVTSSFLIRNKVGSYCWNPEMSVLEVFEGVNGAFAVHNVFTNDECEELIQSTEQLGYDNKTHPHYQNEYIDKKEQENRVNDRCVWEELEGKWQLKIYNALAPHLPSFLTFEDKEWTICEGPNAINNMFRFYRYQQGGKFGLHRDNHFYGANGKSSHLTILIYLNDNFQGGETTFFDFVSEKCTETKFQPRRGTALMTFQTGPKAPWHAGAKVTSPGGVKYVMRSDAMFFPKKKN
eukprot:Lithocolla_globosa_v1_NODE_4997_length_1322_cov_3.119179.p1 type:complete len:259 gc:universal NODE_4997_length_1322_cov_3.119179:528-1304(+)